MFAVSTLTFIRTFLLALLLGSTVAIAEQVFITKDTQLREKPKGDSLPIAAVKQGATGVVTTKVGPWFRISVDGSTGWILMTDFTFSPMRQAIAPSFNPLSSIGRQSVAVATIGIIFCYSHETIPMDQFSEEQLMLLDSYAVSKEDSVHPDELPLKISPTL